MVNRALTGSGSGSSGGRGSLSFGTMQTLREQAQSSFTGQSRRYIHDYARRAMGLGFYSSCRFSLWRSGGGRR